jgi:hypothetical protein
VPVQGWTAGVRYTMSLSGIVRSRDGRELRLERFVSFYAITNTSPAPLVAWYSPADGASVSASSTALELRFSCPMERLSTEAALSIEGMGSKQFEWSDNDQLLKITPEKAPNAWVSCRWSLKTSAKSRDGVPLAKAFSARFSTDQDQLMPKVSRVYPALNSGGRWFPTGSGIEKGLGPGQGIVVEFNKPGGDNMPRSLRFDPSLAGRTEILSSNSIIFIPNRDPEPETAYTLIVSADVRDSEGLKLGEDFRISFVPDIPGLGVIFISADGGSLLDTSGKSGDLGSIFQIPVEKLNGETFLTIRFSLLLSDEEKQNAVLKISLVPFFPKTLPPVALQSVVWVSDDLIRMKWEGLKISDNAETNYYKLFIPGGKGGITGGDGMCFKEDQFLYLEAMR